jgi:hypothetical protein
MKQITLLTKMSLGAHLIAAMKKQGEELKVNNPLKIQEQKVFKEKLKFRHLPPTKQERNKAKKLRSRINER